VYSQEVTLGLGQIQIITQVVSHSKELIVALEITHKIKLHHHLYIMLIGGLKILLVQIILVHMVELRFRINKIRRAHISVAHQIRIKTQCLTSKKPVEQ